MLKDKSYRIPHKKGHIRFAELFINFTLLYRAILIVTNAYKYCQRLTQ